MDPLETNAYAPRYIFLKALFYAQFVISPLVRFTEKAFYSALKN
jgi:hypothetical protein